MPSLTERAVAAVHPVRKLLLGMLPALLLAACAEPPPQAAVDPMQLRNMKVEIKDPTGQAPGTIVVDPQNKFLYLVEANGKALRYGVGVGKEGYAFSGQANVNLKREWPRWTPTQEMIARDPEKFKKWAGGVPGGWDNPLGARALYLYKDGRDTLFRIHGTNEPQTIGHAVSSGCIRMNNDDVVDLYERVPVGAKVVVMPVQDEVKISVPEETET